MQARNGSKTIGVTTLIGVLSIIAVSIWGIPGVSAAQVTATPGSNATPLACAQVLPYVQKNLTQGCNALDRNQICYGNRTNVVTYQDNVTPVPFAQPGDIVTVDTIKA